MINTNDKYLLFIEPVSKKLEIAVDDKLTDYTKYLMTKLKPRNDMTRGWHTCSCKKAHSSPFTFTVSLNGKSFVTNDLLLHYVEFHRSEIPTSELDKLTAGLERFNILETQNE